MRAPRAIFEKFNEQSIRSVIMAQQEAHADGSAEVRTEHLLLGLVAAESHASGNSIFGSRIDARQARRAAGTPSRAARRRGGSGGIDGSLPFDSIVRDVFWAAFEMTKETSFVRPEHIFLAIFDVPEATIVADGILEALDVDASVLIEKARRRIEDADADRRPPPGKSKKDPLPPQIEKFCVDLCERARRGEIDPLIGRDREMTRLIEILARRTKNNPILLGEPGVGKTALAEGLAYAIAHHPDALPAFLRTKRVLQLDVASLMAGTSERGELEARLTGLVREVRGDPDAMLMIDEIHLLTAASSKGGGGKEGGAVALDMGNMLKPALARGELQCIGATTLREYRLYFERDAALQRRFQPVLVDPPDAEGTLRILDGLCPLYERHHGCAYERAALAEAVRLSTRYVPYRHQPDKAIDLMDEAGSRARGVLPETPEIKEFRLLADAKREAVAAQRFEEAAALHRQQSRLSAPRVTEQHVREVVSELAGIPLERLQQPRPSSPDAAVPLLVVGQREAVDAVGRALRRARSGIRDPGRPLACLLFVGPTGVGKTELAKALAAAPGFDGALVRLDMSEYMESHSVSKLVGAPPGYVGYGEGGKLTEAVRRRPSCVVLLDEIEKAHPSVFDLLLQVMEDGRLTDTQGRTVSFREAAIVLTSNLGSSELQASVGGVSAPWRRESAGAGLQRATVMRAVRAAFRPELVNRFDEIVVFEPLTRDQVRKIAERMLEDVLSRAGRGKVDFIATEALLDAVVEEGFSAAYGAREVRRAITRLVEDPLADRILNEEKNNNENDR